ncbi:MAG: tyrosine-type recombinase/integrase, partial [Rhodospirillaceae bacterium]|nr:tyrosine-type recombinase/integrase [Rhodospirillaceae bacterium]
MKKNNEIKHICWDETDEEFKVSVFLKELKTKDLYYARYKIDNPSLARNQRYITESLKTGNYDQAVQRAMEKFAQIKVRQESGVAIKQVTVGEGLDRFISDYEDNVELGTNGFSKHMLRGFKKSIDIYWREYLEGKPLETVSVSDLAEYEVWRRSWATHTKRNKLKHGNYKTDISSRTIQWEVNAFKQFLRWCAMRRIYSGSAFEWKYKLGKRNRRSAFTREQYRKLHTYMRTKEYLAKGKHGNDSRIIRHRHMLRAYILFLVNTGLRVGEARHLIWGDLEDRINKLGRRIVTVHVTHSHSKVKKTRTVVGRYTALRALERWKAYMKTIGEEWSKDSYIFCNEKGQPIQDFREGFNSVIREADVETDRNGNKLTVYSLRHSYITFRIQFAK